VLTYPFQASGHIAAPAGRVVEAQLSFRVSTSSLSDLVEHNRFGDDRRRSGL
jgi:hypothetical protein